MDDDYPSMTREMHEAYAYELGGVKVYPTRINTIDRRFQHNILMGRVRSESARDERYERTSNQILMLYAVTGMGPLTSGHTLEQATDFRRKARQQIRDQLTNMSEIQFHSEASKVTVYKRKVLEFLEGHDDEEVPSNPDPASSDN